MVKQLAKGSMLCALAMICSYIEALVPISIGIPGMKLGLANIVVLTGLYFLPDGIVFWLSMSRIIIMGVLFGNGMSILYSLAGGFLSFFVMICLKKTKLNMISVSIGGAVSHNMAQLAVAIWMLQSRALLGYLPVLIFAAMVSGCIIGLLGGILQKRLGKYI